MPTKFPPAFFLSVVNEYGIRRIRAEAGVLSADGEVLTPMFSAVDPNGDLTDFEVTAYLSPDKSAAWGWTYQYAPRVVELPRAEVMVRVLKRVGRGVAKAEEQYGYATTYAGFLAQVGNALGVRRYITRSEGMGESRLVTHNPQTIGSWVTHQESQYCAPV